jgi:hypothetical protein
VSSLDIVSYSFSLAKEVETVIKSVYILFMGRPDLPRFDAQGAMRRVAEAAEFSRLSPDIAVVAAGVQGRSALLSRILQAADPRHPGLNTGLLAEIAIKANISMPSLLSNLRQERLARGDRREPTTADLRSEAVDRLRQSGFTTESRLASVQYFFEQLRLLDSIEGLEQLSEPNALRFLQTVWYDATLAQQPGFYMMGNIAANDTEGAIKSYHGPVNIYEDVTGQQTPGRRHEPIIRVKELHASTVNLGLVHDQEQRDREREPVIDVNDQPAIRQRMSSPKIRESSLGEGDAVTIDMRTVQECLTLAMNAAAIKRGEVYNVEAASNLVRRNIERIIGEEIVDTKSFRRQVGAVVRIFNPSRNRRGEYKIDAVELAALFFLFQPDNRDRFTAAAVQRRVYDMTKIAYAEVQRERR